MTLEDLQKLETSISALISRINQIATQDPPSLFQLEKADDEYKHLMKLVEETEKQPHYNSVDFEQRLSSLKEDLEISKNLLEAAKSRT